MNFQCFIGQSTTRVELPKVTRLMAIARVAVGLAVLLYVDCRL